MKSLRKYYITISTLFVTTAVLIAGVSTFGFFYLSSLRQNMLENLYKATKNNEVISNFEDATDSYKQIEESLAAIDIALPEKKDSSKLISDLDQLARESGLKMNSIKSSLSSKQTASDPTMLQTIKGKNGYELPLEVKLVGPFPKFTEYINKLENYQRILNIGNVDISRSSREGSPPDEIEVKIKLTAFIKK
jgi:Tfp pilus assembly protein PilO